MKYILLTRGDLKRVLAFFLLGLIVGGAGINVILGGQCDELILQNQTLQSLLEEEQQRLKKLETNYYGTPVVRKVILHLISKEDKHTEQELEGKIKDLLTGLIGLNINQLDTTILRDIVHDRTIPIGRTNYHLLVETIVLDDELTFVVRVEKLKKNGISEP